MTPEEVRTMLDSLRAPVLPPALKNARLRYRVELDDDGPWDILLEGGRLRLADSEGHPDCVVRCDRETFVRILGGQDNFVTALMRGDLQMTGSLAQAKLLYTFTRYAQPSEAKP